MAAVVLRVNSPGGSALASDSIHHELERIRAAGKPIVVRWGSRCDRGTLYVCVMTKLASCCPCLYQPIPWHCPLAKVPEAWGHRGHHTGGTRGSGTARHVPGAYPQHRKVNPHTTRRHCRLKSLKRT